MDKRLPLMRDILLFAIGVSLVLGSFVVVEHFRVMDPAIPSLFRAFISLFVGACIAIVAGIVIVVNLLLALIAGYLVCMLFLKALEKFRASSKIKPV